jgi:N-acetylglucosamine malate deacetylase 2
MRILYVFPHPDDESFGPALAIARQRREGHEVFLLTLTRGGATRQRHRLGLSVEQMGRVRLEEMRAVERVLGLSGMTVWDFPDSGLAEMDPRELEEALAEHVRDLAPDVLVTYPVHGVSGFPDHLVSHAVVKRVFCELREKGGRAPRRLAFFTVAPLPEGAGGSPDGERRIPLTPSTEEAIDVAQEVGPDDVEIARRALDRYETYREVVRDADPLGRVGSTIHFELFQEEHDPRLPSLTAGL